MRYSYDTVALVFDIIDKIFFKLGKKNPRRKIFDIIPDEEIKILDVCTGTGSNIIELARKKNKVNITGIDNSKGMLNVGLKKIKKYNLSNVEFLLQDATEMNLNNSFYDYALISLILHEMDDETAFKTLQNTHNCLKDDGKLIVFEFIVPENKKIIPNIAFNLVKRVENKELFPAFLAKDKIEYFKNSGFKIDTLHKYQYTVVYELSKI